MPLQQPPRIADNAPDDTAPINGRGYHRAVAFGVDSRYAYAWGGGTGSGNESKQIWRYDFDTDTWTKTGLALMPTARGRFYYYRSCGSYLNKLIATGQRQPGSYVLTDIYDIDANGWTACPNLPGADAWGPVGCSAGQYFYMLQGANTRWLYRLDITNPAAGWTVLTAPPASIGLTYIGAAIQCPVQTDRIVVFERDNGGIHWYSISGDSWTDLGDIFPPGAASGPHLVFSVPDYGIIAGCLAAPDYDTIVLYRLDWATPSFIEETTWQDTDWSSVYFNMRAASIDIGGGRTRVIFGSSMTGQAFPPNPAEKWWGGPAYEPAGMVGLNPAYALIL